MSWLVRWQLRNQLGELSGRFSLLGVGEERLWLFSCSADETGDRYGSIILWYLPRHGQRRLLYRMVTPSIAVLPRYLRTVRDITRMQVTREASRCTIAISF